MPHRSEFVPKSMIKFLKGNLVDAHLSGNIDSRSGKKLSFVETVCATTEHDKWVGQIYPLSKNSLGVYRKNTVTVMKFMKM